MSSTARRSWPESEPEQGRSPVAVLAPAPPNRVRWRRVILQAAAVWLASRIGLALVTYFTLVFNSPELARSPKGIIIGQHRPYDFLGSWSNWDAAWYLRIAQDGYAQAQSTAFFPLYPLLVRIFSGGEGGVPALVAAMAVSNVAALVGLIAIGLLAARESGDEAVAGFAVRVTAAYPLAFFLAAPYSEAVFLCLAAGTLLLVRRGAWRWAIPTALLAGLARPTALILLAPLAIEAFVQWRRLENRRERLAAVATVLAVPAAVAAYAAFLWIRFGQPLLFLQVQRVYWQRQAMAPWDTAVQVWSHLTTNPPLGYWEALLVLDLGLVLALAAITVVAARRQPLSFTAYMVGLLYSCVAAPNLSSSNPLSSSGRFLVLAIPAFLFIGRLLRGRAWLDTLVVGGGFLLQAVLLTLYLTGAWVG